MRMGGHEIKKTLEKQLQLLSERSEEKDSDLVNLTHAMYQVLRWLALFSGVEPDADM